MFARRDILLAGTATLLGGAKIVHDNIVCDWDATATSRIKHNPQLGPIGDAIMGAGLHTAILRAWLTSDRTAAGAHEAISYAAFTFLTDRFPDPASQIVLANKLTDLGYNPAAHLNAGIEAAQQVIEARSNDGSNYRGGYVDKTGYAPVNAPMEFHNPSTKPDASFVPAADVYQWQPLKNPVGVVQKFAGPQMGQVTPFALGAEDIPTFERLLAKPAYLQDPRLFLTECETTLSYSAKLDAASKLLVDFWADGPGSKFYPTAHWRYFTADLVRRRGYNLEQTIRIFHAVATSAADAGIMTWRAKRHVNGSRPITGIRNLFRGRMVKAWGGPGHPTEMIAGETFGPFNPSDPDLAAAHQSPGFPGWPSGHAMFSGACARALQLATGGDTLGFATLIPEGFGIAEPHIPASPTWVRFATFSEAARSAAMSRIWSGIHFSPDCSPAVTAVGAKVGEIAWEKTSRLF